MEHVSDELLERYAINRTVESETAYVEEHLIVCEECRERLVSLEQYTTAVRGALRSFVTELIATHDVDGRAVYLYVRSAADGWVARISGPGLEGGMMFRTRAEAERYCQRAFRDMFPEHVCGGGCTPVEKPEEPRT